MLGIDLSLCGGFLEGDEYATVVFDPEGESKACPGGNMRHAIGSISGDARASGDGAGERRKPRGRGDFAAAAAAAASLG